MSDKKRKENLRTVYASIVDYHNNLVQARFTIVSLVLAANGFLAVGYFQNGNDTPLTAIPILGIIFALIFGIVEIRTYILIKNLGERGKELEQKLNIYDCGFFELMEKQPIGPKCPIFQRIITHSFAFGLLYFVLVVFWIYILLLSIHYHEL